MHMRVTRSVRAGRMKDNPEVCKEIASRVRAHYQLDNAKPAEEPAEVKSGKKGQD